MNKPCTLRFSSTFVLNHAGHAKSQVLKNLLISLCANINKNILHQVSSNIAIEFDKHVTKST